MNSVIQQFRSRNAAIRAASTATAIIATLSEPGCIHPGTFQTVADQNTTNADAYAANVSVLGESFRQLARTQSDVLLRRAREGVSADLIRLRAAITPDNPTDPELSDTGAPWAAALSKEAADLQARVNSSAPEQRAQVAASLADAHPATIDLAIASPGFTIPRTLRDAVELDHVNALIETEPNPGVRAGLMTRRDALLDAYLPARNAAAAASRYLAAVDQFLTTIDQQGRVLGVHTQAIASHSHGASVQGTALGLFQNPDLRAGVLDLVAHEWGTRAADDLRTRLGKADDAIGAVGGVGAVAGIATH